MEVIDVKFDSELGQEVAIAKEVTDITYPLDEAKLTAGIIHGPQGVSAKVAEFHDGKRNDNDRNMPQTDGEWLAEQLMDEYCAPILEKLSGSNGGVHVLDGRMAADTQEWLYRETMSDGELGPLKRRSVRNKVMTHRSLKVNVSQEVHQMVVPEALVRKVLWMIHDCMGHPGRNRTAETMRLQYHWPAVARDVKHYVQLCRYCNLRKTNRQGGGPVEIMTYNPSERPGVRVHMDQCGPFPVSSNGAVYILVIKDSMTKYITLMALDAKDMLTVNNAYLNQYLAVFGAPEVLITDRGTEFHNSQMKGLAQLFGVRKISTTPANPQSDGLAENQMGTLKDMLTSFISDHQRDWDEYLQVVAHSYNNIVNDATGFTPQYLTFGTEMGRVTQDHLMETTFNKWQDKVTESKEVLMWCWTHIGERVVKNVGKFNHRPAAPHVPRVYKAGDYCYLRVVPRRSHKTLRASKAWKLAAKLQYRYAGPYIIMEQVSPVLFKARVHGRDRVIHLRNMKAASLMSVAHKKALVPVWEGPKQPVAVNLMCVTGVESSEDVDRAGYAVF
jgi:transposase InsO family protein